MTEFLTDKDIAALLKVSPTTPAVWRMRRIGPPYLRVGRTVRYRRESFERWLREKENDPWGGDRKGR